MEEEEAKNESSDNIYSNFVFANSGLTEEFEIDTKPETDKIIDFLNADYQYNKETLGTYNKFWKQIMDSKDEFKNDFLKIFEKLYEPRLKIENDMNDINNKAYENIKDNSVEDGGYVMMYDYMNGVGQSLRSARGYCFQSCVCMALNVMATLNNSLIRFYNEISFKDFSEVMTKVSHPDMIPLTSKIYEKRRIDIVAVNNTIPAAIIISCKGGYNNTDTEDDVIKKYASIYIGDDGKEHDGYILVTRIHYKGGGRDSQYTYAKDYKDKEQYISHLYDGVVRMFGKMINNSKNKKKIKLERKDKKETIQLYDRSNENEYKYLGDTLMKKQKEQFTNRAKAFCYVSYNIKKISNTISDVCNAPLLNTIFNTLSFNVFSLEEDESGLARKQKQLSTYRFVRLIWYYLKYNKYPNFYHYIKHLLEERQMSKDNLMRLKNKSYEGIYEYIKSERIINLNQYLKKKMEGDKQYPTPTKLTQDMRKNIEKIEIDIDEFHKKFLESYNKKPKEIDTTTKRYTQALFNFKKDKFINDNKNKKKEGYQQFMSKVFNDIDTIDEDMANEYWNDDILNIQYYFKGMDYNKPINNKYYTPQLPTIGNKIKYVDDEDDYDEDDYDEDDNDEQ